MTVTELGSEPGMFYSKAVLSLYSEQNRKVMGKWMWRQGGCISRAKWKEGAGNLCTSELGQLAASVGEGTQRTVVRPEGQIIVHLSNFYFSFTVPACHPSAFPCPSVFWVCI